VLGHLIKQEAQLMLTTCATRLGSVEVNKHGIFWSVVTFR